jgi:hypothetical protein
MLELKNARERSSGYDKSAKIFEEWREDNQRQPLHTPIET